MQAGRHAIHEGVTGSQAGLTPLQPGVTALSVALQAVMRCVAAFDGGLTALQ